MEWCSNVVLLESDGGQDCWALGISIASFIIALIAAVITYRARTVSFQQAVHAKQIEAVQTAVDILHAYGNDLMEIAHQAYTSEDGEALMQVRVEFNHIISTLARDVTRLAVVLHKDLLDQITLHVTPTVDTLEYIDRQEFVMKLAEATKAFNGFTDDMVSADVALALKARDKLGIEVLSKKTRELLNIRREG